MWPYPKHYDLPDARERTLNALMEMSEVNYHRLTRLIPDLVDLPRHSVSRVDGCLDLHLEILDRWTYTSNLLLTYRFEEQNKIEPALNIRIYHDAGMAEAMSGILHRGGLIRTLDPRLTLNEKWLLNRFLYKWLGYNLRRGHSFKLS